MRELQSNLWKINLYKFLTDFLLIAPVMVPFYAANRLTALQFFVVQAIFSLFLLSFEVPSGFFFRCDGPKKDHDDGRCSYDRRIQHLCIFRIMRVVYPG